MSNSEVILNREQVRSVDRIAIEEYGIPGIVLMENAGRGVTNLLLHQERDGNVLIVCGKGNNGGDGFVIARHLMNSSVSVSVILLGDPSELPPDAATNYRIIEKMGVIVHSLPVTDQGLNEHQLKLFTSAIESSGWIVDAMLGTGTRGKAREPFFTVIRVINSQEKPVLAVDIPSGLDCDEGPVAEATIVARITATFVAKKPGITTPEASRYTGEVQVIDIGAPQQILSDLT